MVALAGILSAAFFLPDAGDKRIFALMGVGLACLAVAQLERGDRTEPPREAQIIGPAGG